MKTVSKLSAREYAIPIALMAWFPFRFYWDIAHYHTHFDDLPAFFLQGVGFVFCVVGACKAIKNRRWLALLLNAAAAFACAFFGYWIGRIPFCTECDHIVEGDLGFMLKPYADVFGLLWPE